MLVGAPLKGARVSVAGKVEKRGSHKNAAIAATASPASMRSSRGVPLRMGSSRDARGTAVCRTSSHSTCPSMTPGARGPSDGLGAETDGSGAGG